MDYVRVEDEFFDYPGKRYLIVEIESGFYSIFVAGCLDSPVFASLTYDEAFDKKSQIIKESRGM